LDHRNLDSKHAVPLRGFIDSSFGRSNFNLTERDLKIRAGEWDTQTTKERLPYQERNVKAVVVHQDFHSRSLANDIVIIKIKRVIL
jgi:hypothetical protein